MQLTLHATRRTPPGASRLVQAMSARSVKTRRSPSQHCMDIKAYGHTPMAMHDNEYTPPPPAFPLPTHLLLEVQATAVVDVVYVPAVGAHPLSFPEASRGLLRLGSHRQAGDGRAPGRSRSRAASDLSRWPVVRVPGRGGRCIRVVDTKYAGRGGGRGGFSYHSWPQSYDHRPSHRSKMPGGGGGKLDMRVVDAKYSRVGGGQ